MNFTVPERFLGLTAYGTEPDLADADLMAACIVGTDQYRLWPTSSWLDDPDPGQLSALPWLADMTADPPFRQPPGAVSAAVSQILADADEHDGVVAVWNAPHTLGLLYLHDTELHVPKRIIDVRVLDRQLNPDRSGRRTIWTTADQYGIGYGEISPRTEADVLVKTARAMLAYHQLAMPFQDLMGQQAVWHARQSKDLLAWLRKNRRRVDHVDNGWPLRNDQRLWRAEELLNDWANGVIAASTDELKAAVRVVLDTGVTAP